MEKPNNKQGKKKMAIHVGGGGAVVLWGGAVATAALVSAFVIKRRKRSSTTTANNNDNHLQLPPLPLPTDQPGQLKKNDKDELSKGLHFILPDSSPPIPRRPSDEMTKMVVTHIDAASLVSSQSLISDEKLEVGTNGGTEAPICSDKEILFSVSPRKPESNPLSDDSGITKEDFPSPMFDCPSFLKTVNLMTKSESTEEIEVMKENEAIEGGCADQIAVEDNPESQKPLNIKEQKEECDDDGKIIVADCEEAVEADYNASEMQSSEGKETSAGGDQKIIRSDGSILESNVFEKHTVNSQEYSIPVCNGSSLLKPEPLSAVVNEVMEENVATEAAHADRIRVENPQMQLIEKEQNGDSEFHGEENNVEKGEEEVETIHADQFAGKNDPQMELNKKQKTLTGGGQENFCSAKSKPERGIFKAIGVNVQEFSFPMLYSASLFIPENGGIEAAYADHTSIEGNAPMQLIEREPKEEHDDHGCKAIVGIGEEEVETIRSDQSIGEGYSQMQLNKEQETHANVSQESFFSGKSEPESNPFDDYGVNVQEFSLPVLDSPSLSKPEKVENNVSTEGPPSIEVVTAMKDSRAAEAAHADQITVEGNPQMQLIEREREEGFGDDSGEIIVEEGEEAGGRVHADLVVKEDNPELQLGEEEEESGEDNDEVDDNEEDALDKAEESSEGTGDSSLEFNAEAIWPAESMQELTMEFKEPKIENQKLGEIEEDKIVKAEEKNCHNGMENGSVDVGGHDYNEDKFGSTVDFSRRFMMELATPNNQPNHAGKLKIWMLSTLGPLCFLFYWYLGLPFVKICLIIVFTVILSQIH